MNGLQGVVKCVVSGDTVVLTHPKKLPPVEKTVTLAGIETPKLSRKDKSEEPYAFEARELLRKLCIGKLVTFNIKYTSTKSKRDFAVIFVDNQDVSLALLSAGLAKAKIKKDEKLTEEEQKYLEAENIAKQKKLGVWSSEEEKKKHVRNLKWKDHDVQKLFKQFKGKPVNVIVEAVINGSTLRVLLPTNDVVLVHLTGVQCPPIKKGDEDSVQPAFAKEAKHFTESRILQRDVSFLIEGIDKFQNLYGTILIGKNVTFQEELLSKGFSKVVNWNAASSKFVTQFRAAESKAKAQRLRLWKTFEAKPSTLQPEDKNQFSAKVLEVLSGDTIRVRLENGNEELISLSSIRCKRFAPKKKDDKKKEKPLVIERPLESKERLRRAIAGKKLTFRVDYRRTLQVKVPDPSYKKQDKKEFKTKEESRRFCTILYNNKNVAVDLVASGLATVIRHPQDEERSPYYDVLLAAEAQAEKSGKGLFSKRKYEPPQIVDLTKPDSTGKAPKYFPLLKEKKLKAIVEKVHSGTHVKLFIPSLNYYINFSLAGIQSASKRKREGQEQIQEKLEKFYNEAKEYALDRLNLREVEIIVENVNKVGSFVGTLLLKDKNYGLEILKTGLAKTTAAARRMKNSQELEQAENVAKNAKLKLWSLPQPERKPKQEKPQKEEKTNKFEIFTKGETMKVRVTEVDAPNHIYLQTADAAGQLAQIDKLMGQLNLDNSKETYIPKLGDICFAKFTQDQRWYRAKILELQGDNANVFYIDFGNRETLNKSDLRSMPENIKQIPAQAKEAYLAFIEIPEKFQFTKEAIDTLQEFSFGQDLLARMEYRLNNKIFISLLDNHGNKSANGILVRYGLAKLTKQRFIRNQSQFNEKFQALERDLFAAQRDRFNMWEETDVFDDDEEEDDY